MTVTASERKLQMCERTRKSFDENCCLLPYQILMNHNSVVLCRKSSRIKKWSDHMSFYIYVQLYMYKSCVVCFRLIDWFDCFHINTQLCSLGFGLIEGTLTKVSSIRNSSQSGINPFLPLRCPELTTTYQTISHHQLPPPPQLSQKNPFVNKHSQSCNIWLDLMAV